MCESAFINLDTQMSAEVYYVHAPFRTNSDHRYKVILRDLDSDSIAGVLFFQSFDDAEAKAEKLAFPSSGLINGPVSVPAVVSGVQS
jgi:hypothetical protein